MTMVDSSDRGVEPYDEAAAERRAEAVSLRIAGFSLTQIAQRMKMTPQGVSLMLSRARKNASPESLEELRGLENDRLDRVQTVLWTKVLEGDLAAINTFLRVSGERSRLNGTYAPQKIELDVSVRQEMMDALSELEEVLEMPTADELEQGGIEYAEVVTDELDDI